MSEDKDIFVITTYEHSAFSHNEIDECNIYHFKTLEGAEKYALECNLEIKDYVTNPDKECILTVYKLLDWERI